MQGPDLRILLRSLASRYEGQTYAYCTVVFWGILSERTREDPRGPERTREDPRLGILTELLSVVVISYFALVTAIFISAESTGNALSDCYRTTHGPEPTLGSILQRCGTRQRPLRLRNHLCHLRLPPSPRQRRDGLHSRRGVPRPDDMSRTRP